MKWVGSYVLVPFLFVGFPLLAKGSVGFGTVMSYSSIVWWGVGIGIAGVADILWLIREEWYQHYCSLGLWIMLGLLYFSSGTHALFVFCKTVNNSVSDQLPVFAYTFAGLVTFISLLAHGTYQFVDLAEEG